MFKEKLNSTALNSRVANDYFRDKISGQQYMGDDTLVSSLRALFHARIPEGEYIRAEVRIKRFSKSSDSSISDQVNMSIDYDVLNNTPQSLIVYGISGDGSAEAMEDIHNKMRSVYKTVGEVRDMPELTAVFKSAMNTFCFVNAETKCTVVFVESLSSRRYHYLQAALFKMLPWYYKKEEGFTELEKKLIYSFREDNPSAYLEAIEQIAAQIDFETGRLKSLLAGFEKKIYEKQLRSAKRDLDEWQSTYSRLEEQWRTLMSRKTELEIRRAGIEASMESTEDAILEYFLGNRRFYLYDTGDNYIRFETKGYIIYQDEEILKTYLRNPNSIVYRYTGANSRNGITKEQMKKLLTAVFIDGDIKLRVCASYLLSLSDRTVSANGHWDYACKDYMQNPHIHLYSCMGNYVPAINSALKEYNLIAAFEQCYASSQSLNWADSTVIDKFMRALCGHPVGEPDLITKAFELPDGSVVDVKGAVDWVEKETAEASGVDA